MDKFVNFSVGLTLILLDITVIILVLSLIGVINVE